MLSEIDLKEYYYLQEFPQLEVLCEYNISYNDGNSIKTASIWAIDEFQAQEILRENYP